MQYPYWCLAAYQPTTTLDFLSCFSAPCGLIWACEDIFFIVLKYTHEIYVALRLFSAMFSISAPYSLLWAINLRNIQSKNLSTVWFCRVTAHPGSHSMLVILIGIWRGWKKGKAWVQLKVIIFVIFVSQKISDFSTCNWRRLYFFIVMFCLDLVFIF